MAYTKINRTLRSQVTNLPVSGATLTLYDDLNAPVELFSDEGITSIGFSIVSDSKGDVAFFVFSPQSYRFEVTDKFGNVVETLIDEPVFALTGAAVAVNWGDINGTLSNQTDLQTTLDAIVGIPVGGSADQVLAKVDGTDYNVGWVDQTGGGTWGSITGTLSNQTDLQLELDNKEDAFTKNTAFNTNFGASSGTTCEGDDSRLSDARTPLAHTHVKTDIADADWISNITGESIKDLSDVLSSMTPIDGQVLTFDTTNGWQAETPASGVTDHLLLSNIGVNTHAQIDTHIADASIHYTQASISITESQISDLGSYLTDITGETLGSLSDVDTTGAAASKILEHNGSSWVVVDTPSGGGGVTTLSALTDTSFTSLTDNDLFQYDSGSGDWENITQGSLNLSGFNNDLDADDIDDTSTSHKFVTAAQITKIDGVESGATADQTGSEIKSLYEAEADTNAFTDAEKTKLSGIATGAEVNVVDSVAGKTGAVTLVKADITDFVETDYATGAEGDLASSATQPGDNISSLTNDSGFITSYTVTEGDVTAHEAALSITESQISDLGSYLTDITGQSLNSLSNVFTSMSPTDGQVLTFDTTNGWQAETPAGGGGISNVVEDTTPQLGGNLDVNGSDIVSLANATINILPNGTGDVKLGTMLFDADQTIGVGEDDYVLTYDNATGKISLEAAAGGGGGDPYVVTNYDGATPINVGNDAVVIGEGADGDNRDGAIVIGQNATVGHIESIAIGRSTDTGQRSVAIGDQARATGTFATMVGSAGSTAFGANANNSTVLGYSARATSSNGLCIGSNSRAENIDTLAVGTNTYASDDRSISIGFNQLRSYTSNTIQIGQLACHNDCEMVSSIEGSSFINHGDYPSYSGNMTLYGDCKDSNSNTVHLDVRGGTYNFHTTPANTIYMMEAHVIMKERYTVSNAGDYKIWKVEWCVIHDDDGSSAQVVGLTTTAIANRNAATWDVVIENEATETRGASYGIRCNGAVGKTISCIANVRFTAIA